jgi:hypothetical protein
LNLDIPYIGVLNAAETRGKGLFDMACRMGDCRQGIISEMEVLHAKGARRWLTGIVDGDTESKGEGIGSGL